MRKWGIQIKLLDYQEKILNDRYQDSMAFFMDMGTGKTYMASGAFEMSGCTKCIVVCLTSKIDDWYELLVEDMGYQGCRLNRGSTGNKKLLSLMDRGVVIISFESSWRLPDLLKWVDADTYIIVDESHKIKNSKSKVGKFMLKLSDKTTHKAILTGTPQSKGYIDYYAQLRFLGSLSMTLKEFKKHYCIIEHIPWGGIPVETIVGYKNTKELDEIINECAIYYRRESGVTPRESIKWFKAKPFLKRLKRDRIYQTKSGELKIYDSNGAMYMAMRMGASGIVEGDILDDSRLKWLKDFIESYNQRLIIFYNFNYERDLIIEHVIKDRKFSEYSGRKKDLEVFRQNDDGIVLCNYASASTGINDLVLSDTMIMFSLPTSYIEFEQTKKRIDRIGQTGSPMYYYLATKGSVEEAIYKNLIEGRDFDDKLFERYMEV